MLGIKGIALLEMEGVVPAVASVLWRIASRWAGMHPGPCRQISSLRLLALV